MDFLLLALATWRLTSLLVQEDGPWDFLARFRHWLGVRFDAQSMPFGLNTLAALFTCMWCATMWVAAAFSLAYLTSREWTLIACLPLALSAAALLVNRTVPHE